MHFYTSINSNYLPKARVLAKTVKEFCPESKFSLVYAEGSIPPELNLDEEYFDEILLIEDLNIPVKNLKLWVFEHTVVELCTAVKGPALVKFLNEGSEKVVYLDPDIAVFDSLKDLEELLDRYDVIITPHQTIQERKKYDVINNEICSLKHGIYNYGFFAVKNSENGKKYSQWWCDRLIDFCYDDIPNGIFTDQRWGDLAPALFDGVYIWKDPGCNVSTWNLTNRKVTQNENGIYLVNGSPLKFYHFSGFDSGAQKIMLDLYGGDSPLLYDLREWYIQAQEEQGQLHYGIGHGKSVYNYYDNGDLITKEERRMMRTRQDLLDYFAETDPFIVEQERSYYYWYKNESRIQLEKKLEGVHSETYSLLLEKLKNIESELNNVTQEGKKLSLDWDNLKENNDILAIKPDETVTEKNTLQDEIDTISREIEALIEQLKSVSRERETIAEQLKIVTQERDDMKSDLVEIKHLKTFVIREKVLKLIGR